MTNAPATARPDRSMNIGLYHSMHAFLDSGGFVLNVILAITFVIWLLIIERYWYFAFQQRSLSNEIATRWRRRADRRSRASRMIRTCWLSQFRLRLEQRIGLVKVLVSVSLLLGLLGTVTGMVSVFEGLSVFGAGGPGGIRAVADGVTSATIPAMAGMVAALSGLYFSVQLQKRVAREVRKLRERLALS